MIKRLNDFIAGHITGAMSTMWCAYVFTMWAVVPLIWPASETVVAYVSQAVIQLVALPLIMVGSSVLSRDSDRQRDEDHQKILAEFDELHDILDILKEDHEIIQRIDKVIFNRTP